ncbi:cytochrome P450 [Sistotremastrum suecicum HHB10207 ss-3]|uniref:Cytochrome P450 n=1 Tax=Sistotremastrum suecicum HHB10207 ss-3 TaxID=1314776 RepID=A0A166HSM0_9AGAM|nr:cytochrome P450 [Sistotremastrum suecicum HHB10207 ss-3]
MSLYVSFLAISFRALALLALACITSIVIKELQRPKNMPPTPGNKRPIPFFGNALDIPKEKSWIIFRRWSEQYGPLLTLWNGYTPTILVGDAELAVEIMERRSAKYSSRPHYVLAGDLLTENKTILFAKYGERWRAYRKALHLATMPKVVDTYKPIFEMEGKTLANALIENPQDWYQQIFRYTASSIVAITYGRRILDTRTDSALKKLNVTNDFLIHINVPGAQWHETFPILEYVPSSLNSIKRIALEYRVLARENLAALVQEVTRKMALGIAPHCYVKQMLERREQFPELDDIEFNQASGSLFAAGVDTTSATLQSLVLAMVLHPEVQSAAQAELERVVGHERSPSWEDEDDLPYMKAVIKETMRWRPVAILGGTPHASTEDDYLEYKGNTYFIPKGSIILGSMWTIHMNPTTYPDPESFKPERFMGDYEYPGTGSRGHSSFGWGRRVCPGAYLAERSLFLTASRLLWGFRFSNSTDPKTGDIIRPDASMETGYTSGFNCRPHPFQCDIMVRNEDIRRTIEKEAKDAAEGLKQFEVHFDD